MADEYEHLTPGREREELLAPKRDAHEREFQEAPGETEADAVREAFLRGAGPDPARMASALASADGATRAHAVSRLQQDRGNAFVQRVVDSRGEPGRLVGLSQPDMVQEVAQRKGSGSPLPAVAREPLQDHFGADLGGVRVHADGEAAALNRELGAQAFTVGSDVFFAENKYDPGSREGQGLLAHELTHVGQQTGFGSAVQREAAPEEDEKNKMASGAPAKKPEEETAA